MDYNQLLQQRRTFTDWQEVLIGMHPRDVGALGNFVINFLVDDTPKEEFPPAVTDPLLWNAIIDDLLNASALATELSPEQRVACADLAKHLMKIFQAFFTINTVEQSKEAWLSSMNFSKTMLPQRTVLYEAGIIDGFGRQVRSAASER